MKHIIRKLVDGAVASVWGDSLCNGITYQVDNSKNKEHGDLAVNIALVLAKKLKTSPMEIAKTIKENMRVDPVVEKIEILAPGFINFFISDVIYKNEVAKALDAGSEYGKATIGLGQKIHLEFVSVNPTGPLHVGHGRNAAFGSALANCLESVGYNVHREYYVNDAGRQMDILAVSIYLRYLELQGEAISFPINGYQGAYVFDIAKDLITDKGAVYLHKSNELLDKLPLDSNDSEKYIDALITRCKMVLGEDKYYQIHQFGLNHVLTDIKNDLEEFGVQQEYLYEQDLLDQNAVEDAIDLLRRKEAVYEKDHALWFKASQYGDEKDRVLMKANGHYTYFTTDIANHYHKLLGEYSQIIDVFGADHHGYVARMKAAMTAMGLDTQNFHIKLVQFATLYRGDDKVQMSTRSGAFITLRDLVNEIGSDAARFFYLMRKSDQHMDFDIELAKSRTNDNPVYYIQYAHARICSIFRQLEDKNIDFDKRLGVGSLEELQLEHELDLMKMLYKFNEIVLLSAEQYAPHLIAQYLRELAGSFHAYYNATTFIVEESNIRNARLCLIFAVKNVLCNGLATLGVSSPETM